MMTTPVTNWMNLTQKVWVQQIKIAEVMYEATISPRAMQRMGWPIPHHL